MKSLYGQALVSKQNGTIATYFDLIDPDHFIRRYINKDWDEFLKIIVRDKINRGYFKDREDLRLEGKEILRTQGYEALFEKVGYWVENHMLQFDTYPTKHVVLYNCDDVYRLDNMYHRKVREKLKELGLYNKEIKRRLNSVKDRYKYLNTNGRLNPVKSICNSILEINTLVNYEKLRKDFNDLPTALKKSEVDKGKYAFLITKNTIRAVYRVNRNYNCDNQLNRPWVSDLMSKYILDKYHFIYDGMFLVLEGKVFPKEYDELTDLLHQLYRDYEAQSQISIY